MHIVSKERCQMTFFPQMRVIFLNFWIICKYFTVNVFTFSLDCFFFLKQYALLKINRTNITDTYEVKMRFPSSPEEAGEPGRGQIYFSLNAFWSRSERFPAFHSYMHGPVRE